MKLSKKRLIAGAVLKSAILLTPLVLFVIVYGPYEWLNRNVIVQIYGCGCVKGFNANDFTDRFWFVIAICTTVISALMSIKVLKNKKWYRILWIVIMFGISLLVAKLCCHISFRWR